MAKQLFDEIVEFLARGTIEGSHEGPHNLAGRNAATIPSPLSLASPAPVCQYRNPQLLPICTLAKGERSAHFELHCYLRNKGYCVISEFPVLRPGNRDTVDCVVLQNQLPIAVIELKSYSVHQPGGMSRLIGMPYLQHGVPRKQSIEDDYLKRRNRKLRLPVCPPIARNVPLIQVGLLVAVYDFGNPPVSTAGVPPNHSVAFLNTYICGESPSRGVINHPASTLSVRNYNGADAIVSGWFNGGHQYRHGRWGWGPPESYNLSVGTPNAFPVIGRVGYVCVMT